MTEANDDEEWIVRGLVRNAMLMYRPNVEIGKLEATVDQEWRQGMEIGSTRMQMKEWLQDRMKWVHDGKPEEPNWRDSLVAKELTDLLEWDYWNPEYEAKHADPTEDENFLSIEDVGDDWKADFIEQSINMMSLDMQALVRRRHKAWHEQGPSQVRQKKERDRRKRKRGKH